MNNYKNTLLYLSFLAVCPSYGQVAKNDSTLNRTVVVENQYNPELMDAFKVNVLPDIEEPAVAKKEINYATDRRNYTHWNPVPMQPVTREIYTAPARRGYLRGAYGNRNNTDLKGAYLWDITDRDQLDVMASLYGMSGNIDVENRASEWDSRFFRTDASLNYRHSFKRVDLKIGGTFASQVFNYMNGENATDVHSHQHFYTGGANVSVKSNNTDGSIQFGIGTGLDIFQRKHAIQSELYVPFMTAGSEDKLHTTAFVKGRINDEQQAGIHFTMDNMMYNTQDQDFTLLKFNPYYCLSNGTIKLNAGLNIDIQTSYGTRFRISPDVRFDFIFAESYMISVNAKGNTSLNDYHRLNMFSPYWLNEENMNTTYTPLDASLSIQGAPIGGMKFNIFGGYRIVKDELFALPYTERENLVFTGIQQDDANTAYVGASLDYGFRDVFDLHIGGEYFAWDMDQNMEWLLNYKPQFKINFNAKAKIIHRLSIGLDYTYEGRKEIEDRKANAVNELSISANYSILKNFDAFVGINNLLNKNYFTSTGCPSQGFYVMGGVSFNF